MTLFAMLPDDRSPDRRNLGPERSKVNPPFQFNVFRAAGPLEGLSRLPLGWAWKSAAHPASDCATARSAVQGVNLPSQPPAAGSTTNARPEPRAHGRWHPQRSRTVPLPSPSDQDQQRVRDLSQRPG